MADPLKKILEPINELQNIRGIELPIGLEFLQLVVTGPPGAGKSYYIEQIRGWPNEGYLDLTQKGWWKDQSLIFRPREVHLGLPFHGHKEALTVFDKEWLISSIPLELEFNRIKIPPPKERFWQTNWQHRYIFEFLIPSPSTIYEQRAARQSQGYFPVDERLSLDMVRHQVAVYREVALYLHRAGMNVYVRKSLDKPPMRIAEKGVANIPRWTIDRKSRQPSLKRWMGWKWLFSRRYPTQWLTLDSKPQDLVRAGRIAHDGKCFELIVGDIHLRFQPEIALGIKKRAAHKNWIINTEQGCSTRNINGFVRIRIGETIVIGQTNSVFNELFHFDYSVAKRHVSVTNRRGDLILTPLSPERKTRVIRLDDLDYRERLERGRHQALLQIRRIYGQKITPFHTDEALQTIRKVNALLLQEPFRPNNSSGNPGGLIELSSKATPVIVGDLHAQVDNLLKILSENCLLDCLAMKSANLIILGDAVHSENIDEMDKFETSMLIMDLIFQLKLRFPENFFYLRGNHDSFDPEISKNSVLQGTLFQETLLKHRGPEYVKEMQMYYDRLPYIICSETFIACHAGPPRFKVTRDDLIDIVDNKKLVKELTNNRLQRTNHPAGYSKGDVKKLRKSLGFSQKSRVIVGHTPMDPFGSFWLHAGAVKNHHIIYSAHKEGPSVFIWTGTRFLPISFPAEPLTELINDLK
ncbi:MAG: metallophosphoesterase [Desulforhopalus sp.]